MSGGSTVDRARTANPAGTASTPAARRAASRRRRLTALRLAAALAVTAVMFFPLYWMVVTAFSTRQSLYAPGLQLWPSDLTLANFLDPFRRFPVDRWFRNSLVIATLVTVITVTVNLLAGYAFAKLPFRGRAVLFLVLLSTMMIPVQAIMVPQFDLVIDLGLYGSVWAVVLPTSATVFGIFLARQFFLAIPDELLEAARVDGATTTRAFVSIVLPIARPGMAVLGMLTFMAAWNDFFWPIIALDSSSPTVQVALNNLGGGYVPDQSVVMAGTLVGTLPVIVAFVLLGRQVVSGITAGAVKG